MRYLVVILLLANFFAEAQPYSDSYLNTEANVIKNETVKGANTATRIGQMLLDIIASKNNLLNPPFTLTTSGTAGAATFSSGTLNIPNYSLGSGNTASNGLTQTSFNTTLGGNLDGTATTTTIAGPNNNKLSINLVNGTVHSQLFMDPGNSFFAQGDYSGSYHRTLWLSTGVQWEYPAGTGYANLDGSANTFALSKGAGAGGILTFRSDGITGSHTSGTSPATVNLSGGMGNSSNVTGQHLLLQPGNAYGTGNNNGGDLTLATGVKANLGSSGTVKHLGKVSFIPVNLSFSSNQNNLSIGDGVFIRASTDNTVTRQVTGMVDGSDGRFVIIWNTNSTAVIAFNHEDSGSSSIARIHSSTGTTINLNPGKMVMFFYDATTLRWCDISF